MTTIKAPLKLLLGTLLLASIGCQHRDGAESAADAPAPAVDPLPAGTLSTQPPDGHNSRIAIDWNGTYRGVIPCADCEGIATRVTLLQNGSFQRTVTYLGREERGRSDAGVFSWNDGGSSVTLVSEEGEVQSYQVGEDVLFHLDEEGNRISGSLADRYRLEKILADFDLESKRWILLELMGQTVATGEGKREAFLAFDSESARFSGNNGCNVIFGGYELQEGKRITFGNVASTMMACPDMQTSDRFDDVLGQADNYAIRDGVLSLNRARMATLARFRIDN